MPEDLIDIYVRRVHASLIKKINAYINVSFRDDSLDIEIYFGDFEYRVFVTDMHRLAHAGVSSETIACKVLRNYKQALLAEAFK